MSTEERIIEEAKEYALRNTPVIAETYSVNSYMAGALSERNKTIEEIREEIEKMQNECTDNGEYVVLEQLKEKLDSLTPKK